MRIVANFLLSVVLALLSYVAVYMVYFTVDYFFDDGDLGPAAAGAILVWTVVILAPSLYCLWARSESRGTRFRAAVASIGVALGVYFAVKLLSTMFMVISFESLSYVGTIHALGVAAAILLAFRTARQKLRR